MWQGMSSSAMLVSPFTGPEIPRSPQMARCRQQQLSSSRKLSPDSLERLRPSGLLAKSRNTNSAGCRRHRRSVRCRRPVARIRMLQNPPQARGPKGLTPTKSQTRSRTPHACTPLPQVTLPAYTRNSRCKLGRNSPSPGAEDPERKSVLNSGDGVVN